MTHFAPSTQTETAEDRAERIREFAGSEVFARAFTEGMALVEETANYLDADGREDSKALSRGAALAYAAESMRLTTRLMNVASWLLVQHSVRKGEMTAVEAAADKYRLKDEEAADSAPIEAADELPARLRHLVVRSRQMYQRAYRLDADVYRGVTRTNPVNHQMDMLRQAFGG